MSNYKINSSRCYCVASESREFVEDDSYLRLQQSIPSRVLLETLCTSEHNIQIPCDKEIHAFMHSWCTSLGSSGSKGESGRASRHPPRTKLVTQGRGSSTLGQVCSFVMQSAVQSMVASSQIHTLFLS